LTAYLATSPADLDSGAIIAASSHVDLSFIMALRTIRIVMVLFLGPPIAPKTVNSRQANETLVRHRPVALNS
jgi:uncharacterized membrane protein AbrB (regulator of aidB expression)